MKTLRDVAAVVARVLLLVLHHADDRVRELADVDASRPARAGRRRAASSRRCRGTPRGRPAPRPPSCRSGPRRRGCCGSPANGGSDPVTRSAALLCGLRTGDVALAQLRQHVPAVGGFLLHDLGVRPPPSGAAARRARPPACRLVRPAKTIMMSLPNCSATLAWPDAQPLARGHHQRDRHDAPGDAEHGQRRAQLVRPKGAQGVGSRSRKVMAAAGRYCRTTFSPSFSPADQLGLHAVGDAELDGHPAAGPSPPSGRAPRRKVLRSLS